MQAIGGEKANCLNEILNSFDDSNDELKTFGNSPYYEIEGIENILLPYKDTFTVVSINIQSLKAKFDHLTAFLSLLDSHEFSFSAISIQETWLTQNEDTSLLEIPGYQLIHKGKKCSEHGGVAIYLRDDFSYKILDVCENSTLWDGLFLEITRDSVAEKITLGNIYRPPKYNNCNTTIENFMNEIKPLIIQLENTPNHTVISGDFNINLLDINHRQKFQDYFDFFTTRGFYPKIVLPTRLSKKRGTLIDQIFVKYKGSLDNTISGIIHTSISDHLPCFTSIDISIPIRKTPKYVKLNRKDEESFREFYNTIQQSLLDTHIPNDLTTDPNEGYNILENIIQTAKEKHLKPKITKFKRYKHKLSPWMTSDILNSIIFKDKLHKKLKSTKPMSASYNNLETNFRTYTSILKRSIRKAKIEYYENQFNKNVNNIKNTWNTINEVLNRCKNKKDLPDYFIVNKSKIQGKANIANAFNNYFTNIGPDLSSQIPEITDKSVNTYLTKPIHVSFEFNTIEMEDVRKILDKLKPKTSTGYDDISTKLLKRIAPIIIAPLTIIVNQSLCTGTFPDNLKIAKVIPLFKKGDPHILDNYRPISLLPSMSKVLEKVVFIQIYDYFNTNNLLYNSQYGFRNKHSTELASLELTDQILQHMDNKKVPISVFLDLSKAFDTLDHSILLQKLKYYGIKNNSIAWFQSYLSCRTQYIDIDGTVSTTLAIKTGVPQGSVLGPLLFIIYMNDICMASEKFRAILFADDSNLLSTLCTFSTHVSSDSSSNKKISQNINIELASILEWLNINKLSLNVGKTKFMLFHFRQRKINHIVPSLEINGKSIEQANEFDFLGLRIDQNLTWNAHIQKISNKVSRTLGVMCRLKHFLPPHILRTLYNSLILPHLQYAVLVWGFKSSRLEKLQKRAVRIISQSKYNSHTEPIFRTMNLLKLSDIFKLNILKFYHKHQQGHLPNYFQNLFRSTDITHPYNTRTNQTVFQFRVRTSSCRNCFRFFVPDILKVTPPCITNKFLTHSLTGFTKYVKNYFIANYSSRCNIENCYICNRNTGLQDI